MVASRSRRRFLGRSIAMTVAVSPLLQAASALAAGKGGVLLYQGILTDASGHPLAGRFDIGFRLLESDAGAAGTPLWTELHRGIGVAGGVVQVELGSLEALDAGHFRAERGTRWGRCASSR